MGVKQPPFVHICIATQGLAGHNTRVLLFWGTGTGLVWLPGPALDKPLPSAMAKPHATEGRAKPAEILKRMTHMAVLATPRNPTHGGSSARWMRCLLFLKLKSRAANKMTLAD